jgi:hypothetical protein
MEAQFWTMKETRYFMIKTILTALVCATLSASAATMSNVLNEITKTNVYGTNAAARVGAVNAGDSNLLASINSALTSIGALEGTVSTLGDVAVEYPNTNSVIQEFNSIWWKPGSSVWKLANTNGIWLVNPLDQDSGNFGYGNLLVTAPAGATSVVFSAEMLALTTNDTAMRMAVLHGSTSIGASNVVITNVNWVNATVSIAVSAFSNYNVQIRSTSTTNCSNASFFLRNVDVRWNGTNSGPAFEVKKRYIARDNRNLNERPWANSHVTFLSSARHLGLGYYSDIGCYPSMRYLTVVTNGNLAAVVTVTNDSGIAWVDLGSAGLRTVQVFNGGIFQCDGQNGTWLLRLFSDDSSITFVLPNEEQRMLGFGGSMMSGFKVSAMHFGWPSVFERTSDIKFDGMGWGGQTLSYFTNNWFFSVFDRMERTRPSYLWVGHGYNDWSTAVTLANYQAWYSNLVYKVEAYQPQVRVFIQPPLGYGTTTNANGNTLAEFRNAVTNVHLAFPRTVLVDWTALATSGEIVDGIHPGEAGNLRWGMYATELIGSSVAVTNVP